METEKDEQATREYGRKDSSTHRLENRNGFVDTLLQIVRVVMLFVKASCSFFCTAAGNTLQFLHSDATLSLLNH